MEKKLNIFQKILTAVFIIAFFWSVLVVSVWIDEENRKQDCPCEELTNKQ